MNVAVGPAQIGQWYTNLDTGESFFVTAYDQKARTIELQTRDGDVSEIDEEIWSTLALEFMEPIEEPMEEVDDLDRAFTDDLDSPLGRVAQGDDGLLS